MKKAGPGTEMVGPEYSARWASGTRGLLLGFQVLFNLFKFFSQVWHVIVLSQIHSNHIAQSKSKQELKHDVGGEGEEGVKADTPAPLHAVVQAGRPEQLLLNNAGKTP